MVGGRLLFESVSMFMVSSLNFSTACEASTSLSHVVVCVSGSVVLLLLAMVVEAVLVLMAVVSLVSVVI